MTHTPESLRELLGYTDTTAPRIVLLESGEALMILKFLFTYAIIVSDAQHAGIKDRWCYSNFEDANSALDQWISSGLKGEPGGWHRHPYSGRRRGHAGNETINP